MAGMLLALTVATAAAAGYAYLTASGQGCATSVACDAWVAPAVGGPLQQPTSLDPALTHLGAGSLSRRG